MPGGDGVTVGGGPRGIVFAKRGDEVWEMFHTSLLGPRGSSRIDVKQGMKDWGLTEAAAPAT
eukprot:1557577-Alexandrium_andersonii.AAC.1